MAQHLLFIVIHSSFSLVNMSLVVGMPIFTLFLNCILKKVLFLSDMGEPDCDVVL